MIKINETLRQILIIGALLVVLIFFNFLDQNMYISFSDSKNGGDDYSNTLLFEQVLPKDGVVLPINWNDFGKRMVEEGVIDGPLLESIYKERGGLNKEELSLLYGENNGNIIINQQNSSFILNLLWAFGLANKNLILDEGEMVNPKYNGAGNFASTGGWTISKENSMNYYSKYSFITLSDEQQELVERVSRNIYRPCCNNPTSFPDCNHGMAMLGLLELLAKEGLSEEDMYNIALKVNSYWFRDAYFNIARYFDMKGISWNEVNPEEILGFEYSSASGYVNVLEKIDPVQLQRGESCGV